MIKIIYFHIVAAVFIFIPAALLLNPSMGFNFILKYVIGATAFLFVMLSTSTKLQDWGFLFSALRWVRREDLPAELISYIQGNEAKLKFQISRFGVIPDGISQIYSYGISVNDTRLIVSEGFLKNLTLEEQQSLLSIQIGRIVNRDTMLITYIQSLPAVLYMMIETIQAALEQSSTSENSDEKRSSFKYMAYFWAMYFSLEAFVLWVQRRCDLAADEFALSELKDADRIAAALAKIHFGANTTTMLSTHPSAVFGESGLQHEKFSSIERKIQWDLTNPWAPILELFSPHALLGRRMAALHKTAKQLGHKTNLNLEVAQSSLDMKMVMNEFSGVFTAVALVLIGAVLQFGVLPRSSVPVFFTSYWPLFVGLTCFGLFRLQTSLSSVGSFPVTTIGELLDDANAGPIKGRRALLKASVVGVGDPGTLIAPRLRIRDNSGELEVESFYLTSNDISRLTGPFEIQGWFRRNPSPTFDVYKASGTDGVAQARPKFIAGLIFFLTPLAYYGIKYWAYSI
jgi:Zn-dependent protease with chaperone function